MDVWKNFLIIKAVLLGARRDAWGTATRRFILMTMKKIKTVLMGLGTVNLGLLRILKAKATQIANDHGVSFIIVGVADSSGAAVNATGFEYEELLELKRLKKQVKELKGYLPKVLAETISEYVHADLLIESSAANLSTGGAGLTIARAALKKGWSVVFANKAPLIFAYDELHQLANTHGGNLAFSATVCGGLPVINILQRDLKMSTLRRFRGILNATTNYILNELENGRSPAEAIKEAQRLGAAEADPTHDVHGHDSANKLFIIMKSFTNFTGTISDITVEGIQHLEVSEILQAKVEGKKIKLLAVAESERGQWKLSVKPVSVPSDSFLGTCNGWEMGVELKTDLYESIAMKNYEADPIGTSAAVLRDAIDVCERDAYRSGRPNKN